MMTKAANIDDYISQFPDGTRALLEQLRFTIHKAAPKAKEVISYGMPAFKIHRVLVYFAGYKKHIGFYPTGSGIAAFKKEVSKYKTSKGTVQFSLEKPLPLGLITKIVKFRVREDELKQKARSKTK